MRDLVACPFLPGSDEIPPVWAGREVQLADASAAGQRRMAGVYERGRAVLGEYGIGKSVLVNRIAADLRAEGHWVAPPIRLPVGVDPVRLLAEALQRLVGDHSVDRAVGVRASGLLGRIEQFTLPVVGGGVRFRQADRDPLAYRDVYRLLVALGALAREAGRLVLIRLDEVQNATSAGLSQLLTVLGDALDDATTERDPVGIERERKLPLLVYLSGLPEFRERVAEAGGTFARRFKTWELEGLEEPELRTALAPFAAEGWPILTAKGPAHVYMEPAATDVVVERCLGDPFLFQLAGEAAWNAGSGVVITGEEAARGWRAIRREVVRYVEGRLTGLGDLQLRYLQAAAQLDDEEPAAAAVAAALVHGGSSRLASTAQRLDSDHRLIRREAGRVRFRSPAVRAFLRGGWP